MASEPPGPSILDPRGWLRFLWFAVPIVLGYFALPISMGWTVQDGDTTVATLAENWVVEAVRWIAPASAVALLLLGAWRPRVFPPPALGALVCVFGCGSVVFTGSRALSEGVRGPDGATYVFFHHSIFQGRMAYLGRVREQGLLSRTVEWIEPNQGEFGFCFASLVRPADAADDGTHVAITHDGLVVGMIGQTACATARCGQAKSLTREELETLSPFVLLGASTQGLEKDLDTIVASHKPTEACLLAALGSPNTWIRAATRRIIEAGGAEIYPEATRRLASAPK